jgi:ipoprotein LpqH
MAKPASAAVLVVLTAGSLIACSGTVPPPVLSAGELSAGTAKVRIAGGSPVTSKSVRCELAGPQTTIVTGENNGGTKSTIGSTGGLAALWVELHNVGGFTGSYWQGLGPAPKVKLVGRTFSIEGIAVGFDADNPSARIEQQYSIQAAC